MQGYACHPGGGKERTIGKIGVQEEEKAPGDADQKMNLPANLFFLWLPSG
jgi:hypothetical protein